MVVIVRILSAPRYMCGVCVVGGTPHAETRSPTSVWSTPDSGRLCVPDSIKHTLYKSRVQISLVKVLSVM